MGEKEERSNVFYDHRPSRIADHCSCPQLLSLEDYRKVQEEAKVSRKRTRGEISDESDRSDVEVRPAMTKVPTPLNYTKV